MICSSLCSYVLIFLFTRNWHYKPGWQSELRVREGMNGSAIRKLGMI